MAISEDELRGLLRRAARGENAAYQRLLDEYNARLYGYFLRVTGNTADAADLLGELAVRLVRSLGAYRDCGRFESWLFTLAANLARDRIRRLRKAPKMLSFDADDDEAGAPEPPAAFREPEAELIEAERAAHLHRALNELDAETREMVLLRHFGGLSFAEIARRHDKPLGTVLARVHRALAKLRDSLADVLTPES